nr:NTP transferase domain-containing protein [Cytophagaceae bacterium]
MKIIIPMSGVGQRFVEAGYKVPKPLIEIDGKPIIEHVVDLFPGEKDFIFICNATHLAETPMREVLERIAPQAQIVEIAPHKLGPVYAVSQIIDSISDEEEVIVNYCDFGTYWNYQDFLQHTRNRQADGAIPSYKGFHPHMLGTTNYAFQRDNEQWLVQIQEKKPFTDNRMEEYASNGTYYFRKASFVKKYFSALMSRGLSLNGEYYVSMVYNLMLEAGLRISIYEIQHMLQWGTPGDVEEYLRWSDYFRRCIEPLPQTSPAKNTRLLIPLAGRGNRFVSEGYAVPKPLIPVSGKPMIVQAAACLPPCEKQTFVCLQTHLDQFPLKESLLKEFPTARVLALNQVTEGQACTCALGLESEDPEEALLIAACDNGLRFDWNLYEQYRTDESVDAIVWSFRHHPSSRENPHMYGWLGVNEDLDLTKVSVKVPISDTPFEDHAIVGMFYFKNSTLFLQALQGLIDKNERVNNEFYVDSCLNELLRMGKKVKVLEVQDYIGWGTPNDFRTFEYWQSFFHKWTEHPYRMERDPSMNAEMISAYEQRYTAFEQK